MLGIVEIEMKTIEIVFNMLSNDIELLKMSVKSKWEEGHDHYHNKIKNTFTKLRDLDILIDKVIENAQNDIDALVSSNTGQIDEIYEGDVNEELISLRSTFDEKLKKLKELNFEREMRACGFSEYEDDSEFSIKSTRRLINGEKVEVDVDKL